MDALTTHLAKNNISARLVWAFFMPMQNVITAISEWKGRLIAYIGGGGVSVYSAETMATSDHVPNLATAHQATDILATHILPGVPLGSFLSIIGAAVVVGRFIFDVWKYFDQRRLIILQQEGK